MASSFSGIGKQTVGSFFGPIFQATKFTDLAIALQSQADASVQPSESPAEDTARLVVDATPRVFLWVYDLSATQWYGVEMTA